MFGIINKMINSVCGDLELSEVQQINLESSFSLFILNDSDGADLEMLQDHERLQNKFVMLQEAVNRFNEIPNGRTVQLHVPHDDTIVRIMNDGGVFKVLP